uniref:Uncharacterized protein n=1 Tax=Myotis myotis TaxID=51298 RepID=A0A7J7ZZ00_MYOMY|nr:hypothetical protein mMyoMyo1_009823 [Myotis myotis]
MHSRTLILILFLLCCMPLYHLAAFLASPLFLSFGGFFVYPCLISLTYLDVESFSGCSLGGSDSLGCGCSSGGWGSSCSSVGSNSSGGCCSQLWWLFWLVGGGFTYSCCSSDRGCGAQEAAVAWICCVDLKADNTTQEGTMYQALNTHIFMILITPNKGAHLN